MNKILIIRLGAIGDVIHTTNLYRSIKRQNPEFEIHYLTEELIKPLLEADVDIAKIITVKKKFNFFSFETKKLIEKLRKEKYDYVFNLQPSIKNILLVLFLGIKNRYIYKKDYKVHAVKNFWQTGLKAFPNLEEIKDLKLYLPKININKAKEELNRFNRPIVAINAGGMFSKRQGRSYPIEKWIELCKKFEKEYNAALLLTGTIEDREFLLPLTKLKNSIDYIGKLSLKDFCAVISQTDIMISGDSGPLHIACALGVKSIGLYGSMPQNRTGCYCNGVNIVSNMPCVPCNKRKCKYLKGSKNIYAPCMEDISPDIILKCFEKIFCTHQKELY